VYLQYQRKKGDARSDAEILGEGRQKIAEIRDRGVFIAEGYGDKVWDMEPQLAERVRFLYEDSKKSIWAELPADFASSLAGAVVVSTQSADRLDYILHPPTGEVLASDSAAKLKQLGAGRGGEYDVQIVISDGLNAYSITDEGHLEPYLTALRAELAKAGYKVAPQPIVVLRGRVRAGYRIGELLWGGATDKDAARAVLHVIGERPGSGHHAFSTYITAPAVSTWAKKNAIDHNITKLVSGIADTALAPGQAALDTVSILQQMAPR
jgi:ethanolamine ammonia-lyase large subunit